MLCGFASAKKEESGTAQKRCRFTVYVLL